jgi:WD40 repeat protein
MSETTGVVEHRDNPYFGLDYYEEKYGSWFFGRESEGSKIITNLRAARLTLLHAESGVGKSSLLRAGVAWRMRKLADDNFARRGTARSVPIVFSSWRDDPVLELTGAIRTAIKPYLAGRLEPKLPTDQLDAAIEAASEAADASLLIMLDQFEEYFLYRSREPTPERFADELGRCINRTDLRANFLIAIREDAYAALGDLFKGRIPNVYSNYLHVEYLDRASAEKAIREPLDTYNGQPDVAHVQIQNELVEAVLDQVRAFNGDGNGGEARAQAASNGDGSRVATPLLQLVMETVWERERAAGSHELRLSTLQDLHGVRMIVDAHLGQALNSLDSGKRKTAIDMFDHLVTPSGGKIAESVPDLAKRTGHSEAEVGSILDRLDHERIVRPIPAAPGQDPMRYRRYEIFHDVLAPTINRAIAAREERRRARKRLRKIAVLALGLLVAAAIAFAVTQLSQANSANKTAESRQLAAAADMSIASDPELSALLALQALHVTDTSQAEAALRQALPDVQEVRTLRNGPAVFDAVFDPVNPDKVVSAGKDGNAWIWDVKTGRRLVRLRNRSGFTVSGTANAVAFNAAGTQVAVGYSDGTVILFDASSGKELRPIINVGPSINDIRYIGSTGGLAIATQNGVRKWLPGRGLSSLSQTQATTIAIDPQDPLIWAVATPYPNATVIWNLHTSPATHRNLGAGDYDAEFSPNGREVVLADSSGYVYIYNVSTRQQVMQLNASEGTAYTAAFSHNGQLVVSGYSSGATRVWDAATGLQQTTLTGNGSTVYTARFSPTGSEIVTASEDGTVRVWQAEPRELQREFTSSISGGTPNPVFAAQYSPGGGRILVVDTTTRARVFSANGTPVSAGGQPVVLSPGGGASVYSARFNRAGTEVVTANSDGTVSLWHASGPGYTQIRLPSPITLQGGAAQYADFSPDGSRIAVVTNNDTAELFSSQTGRLLQTLNPKHYFALSVAVFSFNGHQVFTGDDNGQVEVWNTATGREMRVLGKPGPAINDVEFNKSGNEFVTASDGGIVTIWNGRNYRQVRSINACPSPSTASFSPDGSTIVVACGNGGAPVFATATGQQLTLLEGANVGEVNSAAFSPDGKNIVTTFDADNMGGVRIWSSGLATTSLPALERLAEQRVTGTLTPSERQEYLTGVSR